MTDVTNDPPESSLLIIRMHISEFFHNGVPHLTALKPAYLVTMIYSKWFHVLISDINNRGRNINLIVFATADLYIGWLNVHFDTPNP